MRESPPRPTWRKPSRPPSVTRPGGLDAALDAWSGAIDAWGRALATAFGPIDELRLASTIRSAVDADKVLALAATSPTAGDLASAGADVRGLDAVGVLLAGGGSEELATSGGGGRCAYASVVAHQAATAAAEVAAPGTTSSPPPYPPRTPLR